jgi:broad specificity phosphatase PhoE
MGEEGWWNRPFEAELHRPERARRVLVELLQRHGGSNDRVAMVSHGAFITT